MFPPSYFLSFVAWLYAVYLFGWLVRVDFFYGRINIWSIVFASIIVLLIVIRRWINRSILVQLVAGVAFVLFIFFDFYFGIAQDKHYPLGQVILYLNSPSQQWKHIGRPCDGWRQCPKEYAPDYQKITTRYQIVNGQTVSTDIYEKDCTCMKIVVP